uniref:Uncharacterized protein n=1 Tax=Heterorhabditis bacteriophora TaxID=37862 RepID=A0A1I7X6S4_HETBA
MSNYSCGNASSAAAAEAYDHRAPSLMGVDRTQITKYAKERMISVIN